MEAEETSDALAVRVRDLSHILEDQAETLDPDGTQRANLDRIAAWWAEGQRYEPGYQAPKPALRRAKRRPSRPPRPRDVHPKDVHPRDDYPGDDYPEDDYPEDIPDLDIDDAGDEPPWRESG